MGKVFNCGDVVQGCQAKFSGESEAEILRLVAQHAQQDHDMTEVPAAVVEQVQQNIHDD